MAKLANLRERVHQPFRDTLIRTAGWVASTLTDRTDLFTNSAKAEVETNLRGGGGALPSDQSMVVLALRVLLWFKAPVARSAATFAAPVLGSERNGDYWITAANNAAAATALNGSVPGDYHDVYRLYWQASEQLCWTFGFGEKPSLINMPSSYFPWGGGLHGDVGGQTDLIHFNNGSPDHSGILRIARAVLGPARQQIKCNAQITAMSAGANSATFGTTQGSRDMLRLTDNLNWVDGITKTIALCFDGLFSRDVQ